MSNIDSVTLDEVFDEGVDPLVTKPMMKAAISFINERYAKLRHKRDAKEIDFKEIMEDAIDQYQLRNFFEYEPYKIALGKYYRKRRDVLKKFGKVGDVLKASATEVAIRASREVVIYFRAPNNYSQVHFREIDDSYRLVLFGNSDVVENKAWWKAKQQALAVMNSRRK